MSSSWVGLLFRRFRKGDSLHKAVNAENFNTLFNILEDIQGEGCTIVKTRNGLGWKIVVNGTESDIEPISPPNAGGSGGALPDGDYYFVVDIKWENYQLQKKVNHWNVTNGVLTINEGDYETIVEAVEEQI